jgi:hypothetical protein
MSQGGRRISCLAEALPAGLVPVQKYLSHVQFLAHMLSNFDSSAASDSDNLGSPVLRCKYIWVGGVYYFHEVADLITVCINSVRVGLGCFYFIASQNPIAICSVD